MISLVSPIRRSDLRGYMCIWLFGCFVLGDALAEALPGNRPYVATALWLQLGSSSVDYEDDTELDPQKDIINGTYQDYHTGFWAVDSGYQWSYADQASLALELHIAFELHKTLFDDDQIDELSVQVQSTEYGRFYLGEDDGAADRLKPPQAGRVSVAVGQGPFTGIIPWWGNLPYLGGPNRDELFDWRNGIVHGDLRAFSRDTGDAIKIGYQSPALGGWTLGASVNLQKTYAGFSGFGSGPVDQDRWDDLQLSSDEFELALYWAGRGWGKLQMDAGLIYMSAHIVNEAVLQKSTDASVRFAYSLDPTLKLASSAYYALQQYEVNGEFLDDDHQINVGLELQTPRWTWGANYLYSRDHRNPPATVLRGGGSNQASSLGIDYQLFKGFKLGTGFIWAKNQAGERATEVALMMNYRVKQRWWF